MGLIMAGLGGAAEVGMNQMQDQRRADLQTERDLAQEESGKRMAQYNSDLSLKREEALATLKQKNAIAEEKRQESPERLAEIANVSKTRFTLGAEERHLKTTEALDVFRQQSEAQLTAEISKLTNPKFIAGTKAFQQATRDTSGDAERALRVRSLEIAIGEKQAELKMPYAERQIAESIKDQLKSKSAAIDKATTDPNSSPEGIAKLQAERAELSRELTKVYEPFRSAKAGNGRPDAVDPKNPLGLKLPPLDPKTTKVDTKTGGLMASPPPAEFASRVAAMEQDKQDRAKTAADKLAQDQAKTDSDKASTAWLTPERISVMKPNEAHQYIRKYGNVLTRDQRQALNKQL